MCHACHERGRGQHHSDSLTGSTTKARRKEANSRVPRCSVCTTAPAGSHTCSDCRKQGVRLCLRAARWTCTQLDAYFYPSGPHWAKGGDNPDAHQQAAGWVSVVRACSATVFSKRSGALTCHGTMSLGNVLRGRGHTQRLCHAFHPHEKPRRGDPQGQKADWQ